MIYTSELLHREEIARETLSIRVAFPSGFSFVPGQYVDLTIPDLESTDALGPGRSLTIASAPGADHLEFVVRVRDSAFKQRLRTMPVRAPLRMEGPFNDLRLRRVPGREMVFLAGGVGVAPFLSILRHVRGAGESLPATLFYSNRCPEDAVYLEFLRECEEAVSEFRFVATMTRTSESKQNWYGETRRIGLALLEHSLPTLKGRSYYLAGAPFFITQLRNTLLSVGIRDAEIGIEMYAGY